MSRVNEEKIKDVLKFILSQTKKVGYPPSVREIQSALEIKSTSTVHSYLNKLKDQGYIAKDDMKTRALKVLKNPDSTDIFDHLPQREIVNVPVVGKVAAGTPILAIENIDDMFPLPIDFTNNSDVFILKVQGDSMIEAGILNKDFIVIKKQSTAVNGDFVVALIDDEATVKTYYKEKDHIRLQPENKNLEPIIVKNELSILGKVIAVFRKI